MRIKDHKTNEQKGTRLSKLVKHAWDTSHRFKFEETRVINFEAH